ncbi:MAG: GIY-YIG nuclease family protein [Thalassovita sp.]
MVDVVYILTNVAMPGMIKIGKTKAGLKKRLQALDSTSVPLPFECFYAAKVADCHVAEKLLHDAFSDQRVRASREFFWLNPERAASALKLAALEEVTPFVVNDAEDEAALNKANERRSRFSFRMVGISPGAELYHIKDENEICQVADAHRIEYQGEIQSLSQAALSVYHKLGFNWKSVSGPESWMFEGESLNARRLRLDAED